MKNLVLRDIPFLMAIRPQCSYSSLIAQVWHSVPRFLPVLLSEIVMLYQAWVMPDVVARLTWQAGMVLTIVAVGLLLGMGYSCLSARRLERRVTTAADYLV